MTTLNAKRLILAVGDRDRAKGKVAPDPEGYLRLKLVMKPDSDVGIAVNLLGVELAARTYSVGAAPGASAREVQS